jgi:hypothetical protein
MIRLVKKPDFEKWPRQYLNIHHNNMKPSQPLGRATSWFITSSLPIQLVNRHGRNGRPGAMQHPTAVAGTAARNHPHQQGIPLRGLSSGGAHSGFFVPHLAKQDIANPFPGISVLEKAIGKKITARIGMHTSRCRHPSFLFF